MPTFADGESGLSVRTKINNVLQHADGTAGELVINEAGTDVDFRVESDTQVNALFVDGANGRVGLGTGTPTTNLDVVAGAARWRLSHDGVGNIQQEALNSAGALYSNMTQFANLFVFSTSGTERLRIDTSGNVGIGTSSVSSVFGTTVKVFSSGSGGTLDVGGSAVNARLFGSEGLSIAGFGTSTNHPFILFTNDTERLRVNSSGNVGIGTSSPSKPLHLSASAANTAVRMSSVGGTGRDFDITSTTSGALAISSDLQANLAIFDGINGNVGIGTSSPNAMLEVQRTSPSGTGPAALFYRNQQTLASLRGFSIYNNVSGGLVDTTLVFGDTVNSYLAFVHDNGSAFNERMRIDASGNVGIGTSSPNFNVEVRSAGSTTVAVGSSGATSLWRGFSINDGATEYASMKQKFNDGEVRFTAGLAGWGGFSTFYTNGSERMRIDSSGNVGIGTSGPAAKLHVVGDAYIQSGTVFADALTSYGGTSLGLNGGSSLIALTSGTERLRIDSGGNVGVGTAAPESKFDVYDANASILKARVGAGGTGVASVRMKYGTSEQGFYVGSTNALIAYDYGAGVERMRLDASGNLGLGVVPSAWGASFKAVQVGATGALADNGGGDLYLLSNARFDGTNFRYLTTNFANYYAQENGVHQWHNAPSGTAGDAITFTQAMTLDASGNLLIGTTSSGGSKLRISGLPTSSAGLSAGDVWNDGGTLKIA